MTLNAATANTVAVAQLRAAIPTLDGEIAVPGLHATVQVWRDEWGIPHIRAAGEHDAWFAQGFVTAQDRLWSMEYDRLRAVGRWSAAAGSFAVGQDMQMRRLRLEDASRADCAAAGSRAQAMLQAYADGINAFINSDAPLPAEYAITGIAPEPWEPWHSLAVFKVRHIFMGVFESKAWRARLVKALGPPRAAELFPSYPPGQPVIIPTGADYTGPADFGFQELLDAAADLNVIGELDNGSNSWVLSGEHTTTGKPILAGDSHRGLDVPSVYYQNHLACDAFDVIGASFPGVPGFPHFGHNQWVSWSVTHTSADYQDLYIERFNDADPSLYQRQSDWYNADVREEVIKVRGGNDVHLRTWATHHGPIVAGNPLAGYGLALRYTATDGGDPWTDILPAMLEAGSVIELADSMDGWVDPVNNFLMADVHGNIGYQCRGEIPRRPGDAPSPLPLPGWNADHEWQGSIPFDQLPRYTNPDEGFIVTANNRPVGDDYPYYISMDFAPPFRAATLLRAIRDSQKLSAADMPGIHALNRSIPAVAYVEALAHLPVPDDPIVADALRRLRGWSCEMQPDAVEPTIYSVMRDVLQYRVLRYNIGEDLAALTWNPVDRGRGGFVNRFRVLMVDAIETGDANLLPVGENWSSALASSLAEAVRILTHRLGPDLATWRWDSVHRARPQHPLAMAAPELAALLNPPEILIGGDGDTPWAGSYSPADLATVGGLSVFRYAYDLNDWEGSLWAVPLGSSGHPGSDHYADQSNMWANVQMSPMRYNWDSIEATAKTGQILWAA